jgi:dTMP kinase
MSWYIVIKGDDGVGKSTLAKLLAERINAYYTFEPYGGSGMQDPRYDECTLLRSLALDSKYKNMTPIARELIMLANRSIHQELLKSKLLTTTVVSDRSYISGLIYRKISSPNFPSELWVSILDQIKMVKPDVVVYVTADSARLKSNNDDIYDTASSSFHNKIKKEYRLYFDEFKPEIRFINDFSLSIEENVDRLLLEVRKIWPI